MIVCREEVKNTPPVSMKEDVSGICGVIVLKRDVRVLHCAAVMIFKQLWPVFPAGFGEVYVPSDPDEAVESA